MSYFINLFPEASIAYSIMVLTLVVFIGLVIGNISFFQIRLGSAGVLFSGILFGHFHVGVDPNVLGFIRELGLILFVYSIGLQIGPGFLTALRCQGIRLNLLALFIVLSGVLITYLIYTFGDIPLPVAVGMLSGATTNTPSLAAAQEALREVPGITPVELGMMGLGYAVAYPFGIIGIIFTILLLRLIFKIDLKKEEEEYENRSGNHQSIIARAEVELTNKELDGLKVKDLLSLKKMGVIISRVMHQGNVQIALRDTHLFLGDILRLVGPKEEIAQAKKMIGVPSSEDLSGVTTSVQARRLVVTKSEIDGKTISSLHVREKYRVNITRVCRNEIEIPASPGLKLHLSDVLVVVGEEDRISRFAHDVGNCPKDLDHPFLIPIFLGIALGVLLGSIPIYIPGVPGGVKLGLAGGPLIVAIIFSYIGRIGKVVWYLPPSANFMLREIGIVFFLACVGIKSGKYFFQAFTEGDGLYWMACSILITFIPLFLTGIFAYRVMGINFLTVCGLLPGGMTDPPALAFVQDMSRSNVPPVAYATVYPLVMIIRILSAQLLILFLG